jgi:hypothetical protein
VRYYAPAIGDDGRMYLITWQTVAGWKDHISGSDGQCVVDGCGGDWCADESNACDWDNPIAVEVR